MTLAADGDPTAEGFETSVARPAPRTLDIRRVFRTTQERLFEMFADPRHMRIWFGPPDRECSACEIDLRVGGRWQATVPLDRGDHVIGGEYRLIEPHDRLAFTWAFGDGGDWGPASLVSLTFRTVRLGAELHLVHSELSPEMEQGHERGWRAAFEGLAAYVDRASAD